MCASNDSFLEKQKHNLHIEVSDETPFFAGTHGRHLEHAQD